jgi:hypothetical protein
MVTTPPHQLNATTSQEFRRNGERELFLDYLARVRPDMDRSYRLGIARMLERALDALGNGAVNQAIRSRALFENRLRVTPFSDYGYPNYFRERTALALRYLRAAAHEASADELDRFLDGHGPPAPDGAGEQAAEPFNLRPASQIPAGRKKRGEKRPTGQPGSRARASASGRRSGGKSRAAGKTRRTALTEDGRATPARRAQPSPSHANGSFRAFESMLAASLQRMDGDGTGVDSAALARLLDPTVELLDVPTVVELLNDAPDGWRRTVRDTATLENAPTPAAVARLALKEALVARLSQRLA